jgi:hypothetical protein
MTVSMNFRTGMHVAFRGHLLRAAPFLGIVVAVLLEPAVDYFLLLLFMGLFFLF